MKTKANLFAALALVVMTGFFNPVGVPQAMAQASVQVGGKEALKAIDGALKGKAITQKAADTLREAVIKQQATVAVQNGSLVVGGSNAALAAGAAGFTAANVAVVAIVVAGVAAAVSSDGSVATTGTTGTR